MSRQYVNPSGKKKPQSRVALRIAPWFAWSSGGYAGMPTCRVASKRLLKPCLRIEGGAASASFPIRQVF